jgi:hypothetical protein
MIITLTKEQYQAIAWSGLKETSTWLQMSVAEKQK